MVGHQALLLLVVLLLMVVPASWSVVASSPCSGGGSLPAAPGFPTAQYPNSPPSTFTVTNHWSEVAKMPRPDTSAAVLASEHVQTNCPHKLAVSSFAHFHALGLVANGNPITLPANTRVLVSTCSLPSSGGVFGVITVPGTSELVFNDDGPITLATKGIAVQPGGKLLMGSQTCRLRNRITINFHGTRSDGHGESKGIIAIDAQLELHGQRYLPTWTRLANTVLPGASVLFVQDRVNWQPGQRIVVTTTELKDSREQHQNEEREIAAVFATSHANVTAVTVTQPFSHKHFAGRAYQAEVALLSRSIVLQGDLQDSRPTDVNGPLACTRTQDGTSTYPCTNQYQTGHGFHVRIEGTSTVAARFRGVEWTRSGQTNVLARYSLHYHMLGQNTLAGTLYARDCSVHDAYFRAYAIHGTNQVELKENVAFDVTGHAYFLEDGVEELNVFHYNFGALVHWLGSTTQNQEDQYYSQTLTWVTEQANSLILPSDSAAAVFYITNAYNSFLGNAASGGWAGYGFVNLPKPVKMHRDFGAGKFTPKARPLLLFRGNTAHSTGYWFGSSGGVYVGGTLRHKDGGASGLLEYTAGRDGDRDTCAQDPELTWGYCQRANYRFMVFEDTKVFLSSRGIQQWGRRAEIHRAEVHDVGESMNVFGQVYLTQMLVQCRTLGQHSPENLCLTDSTCASRDGAFFKSLSGFSWYDVYQSHIMTKTEFRNCNMKQIPCPEKYAPDCSGSSVFRILTHSNQFVPEVMQASREIKYTNFDLDTLVGFTVKNDDTVSARLANWLDMDGTVFPGAVTTKQPVLLGSSNQGSEWWKTSASCLGPRNDLYICPKGQDSAASMYFGYDEAQENLVGSNSNNCPNGHGTCKTIGSVTHFGRALGTGILLAQNPKITGPVLANGGGWYVRFDAGTPKSLKLRYATVHPDDVLIIAVPYPAGSTFQVIATDANSCGSSCQDVLVPVNSLAEVRQGFGDRYYYSASEQLLYFRVVQRNSLTNGAHVPWVKQTLDQLASFTREGITLMVMDQWTFTVEIKASNCGTGASSLYCGVVAQVNIPGRTEPPAVTSTWAPTLPTPTPTKMPSRNCVALWEQCAGFEWQGCCLGDNVECVYVNEWYSSCTPATKSPTATGATAAPTKTPTTEIKTPTKAPTKAPSAPTKQPTLAPTKQPTLAPTFAPTGQPTRAPTTLAPTKLPTKAPTTAALVTAQPTLPTPQPTKRPTLAPTKQPTSAPTPSTTKAPTMSPASSPMSKTPTKKPTVAPTARPTSKTPTKYPTKAPTSKPTKAPTKVPSKYPSKAPSKYPTKKPTKAPTNKPTTKYPTKYPTKPPTSKPTAM